MEESIQSCEFFFHAKDPPSVIDTNPFNSGRMGFPERLLSARERSRLSQDELGQAIGSSGPTIHRWEKGTGGPSLKQAVDLARVLGVDLEYLAYEDPPHRVELLSQDQASLLDLYHALRLDPAEALRRLATPTGGNPAPPREQEAATPAPGRPRYETIAVQHMTDVDNANEVKRNRPPTRKKDGSGTGQKGGKR